MARFFIDRPIFAAVISVIITLAGVTPVVHETAWVAPRRRLRGWRPKPPG